jgi:hypothetical protein
MVILSDQNLHSIVGSDIASNKYTHPFPRKGLTWYGIKAYNSVGVPSAVMATTSIFLSVNDRINIFQTTHIDFSEGTITGAGRISAYNEALGYTSRAFEISPANKWDQDNWDDNGEAWDKPVEEAIAVFNDFWRCERS